MGEGRVMRYIALKINFDKFLILLFFFCLLASNIQWFKIYIFNRSHKNKYF